MHKAVLAPDLIRTLPPACKLAVRLVGEDAFCFGLSKGLVLTLVCSQCCHIDQMHAYEHRKSSWQATLFGLCAITYTQCTWISD